MKYILSLFLCMPAYLFSQNWSLFPTDQRSFYQNTATGNIVFTELDSSIESPAAEKNIFDEFPAIENAGDCESYITDVVTDGMISCPVGPAFPSLDSIVYRNDTAHIYGAGILYDMFFLPKAKVNDSWHILPATDNILIKCTAVDTQSIFGITDSVKIFSFYKPAGSTILSVYKMVLSKNYGLLNFVDFIYLTVHTETSTPVYYNLKGMEHGGSVYGFKLPVFTDYFPYAEGDKLFWQYHLYNPAPDAYVNYIYYRNDSITEKTIYADSIVFRYNAVRKETSGDISYLYDQKNVFIRSEFEPLLFSAPEWLSVTYNMYGSFPSDMIDIWCTEPIVSDLSDSVIYRTFYTGSDLIIPDDCWVGQTTDQSFGFSINTRAGISSYGRGSMSTDETWTLIGSVVNGEENGITSIHDAEKANNILSIFPNPATSCIKIGLPENNYTYKIYNCNGQLILSGMLKNDLIDIAELAGGIYFLEIKDEIETANIKFIKM